MDAFHTEDKHGWMATMYIAHTTYTHPFYMHSHVHVTCMYMSILHTCSYCIHAHVHITSIMPMTLQLQSVLYVHMLAHNEK